jgi:carbonic anhydrase
MTFPFVKSAVENGDLHLHGAYFGVASGRLLVREETTGNFEPVG